MIKSALSFRKRERERERERESLFISNVYIYAYIVCQGSSALAKYSVQSRNITQAKIKMKKFTSRALFSHS